MNLKALEEILNNHIELIEESAEENGADVSTVIGIAKFAANNSYDDLSPNQQYHFNQSIRHLIEDLECEGYRGPFGEDDPICEAILNDNDLVDCYQEDSFLCSDCQSEAANDQYARDKFMED